MENPPLVSDLLVEYEKVTNHIKDLQFEINRYHDLRTALVWQIRETGLTHRKVAMLIGVSNARVGQLISAYEAIISENGDME